MKISAPTSLTVTGISRPSVANSPTPSPDQLVLSGYDRKEESRWKVLAGPVAAVAAGAAVGVAAGLHGGLAAQIVAVGSIPGLALGGFLVGGMAYDKYGDANSDNGAWSGVVLGTLAGVGAGLAQTMLNSGGPVAATTLGISGGLMGLTVFLESMDPNR